MKPNGPKRLVFAKCDHHVRLIHAHSLLTLKGGRKKNAMHSIWMLSYWLYGRWCLGFMLCLDRCLSSCLSNEFKQALMTSIEP